MSDDDDDFRPDAVVALPIDGVLDLHTFDPRELGDLLPTWIDECRAHGLFELRIVHGKGTGALRRSVHAILARRDDVLEYRLAPPERGGWGATLVTLRKL
ncbi:Smr/MutS family protein [Sandaracinus amylolyticus]|uniref:Recombination inhibitory protein MutS2 n=1 Tax=Sandaracinus amylolyticus TaxID=927083 RepID=A0A0F6W9Y8_9BACT|nr:Smr/MutS family protein [Sandaracinus amylolyticus]AKF11115.1 Recombination inhibitory protein MutS2 [Sandaracinus amylolyticus]